MATYCNILTPTYIAGWLCSCIAEFTTNKLLLNKITMMYLENDNKYVRITVNKCNHALEINDGNQCDSTNTLALHSSMA